MPTRANGTKGLAMGIDYTHPNRKPAGRIVLTGTESVVIHRAPSLAQGESIALPPVKRFNPENVPADQRPAHTGGRIAYVKRAR